MRGGYARGLIIGGYGNDTLTVDNNKYKLSEVAEGGIDTVKSTVSYRLSDNVERLYLLGKADINAIGNASDNILKGNSGDNVLTGGAGADTFIFGTNSGTDTITDFTHGTDKIDLSHWKGISDFNEMVDHSHYTSSQASVTLGDDTLIIKLAADAVLTPDDFIFG
jgi:Ca2+-binding RTX toxin-like protein